MLPSSAIAWKGRCQYSKATMVPSTFKWLSRWETWEMPMGTSAMQKNSASSWKGRCKYTKATMVRSTHKWQGRWQI
eukprot:2269684-Amphidinium_carterae.1